MTDLGYTFFVNINSTVTQVYPLNWLECTLNDELERVLDCIMMITTLAVRTELLSCIGLRLVIFQGYPLGVLNIL